jgi:tripartite-type tricarboxylate transporter receptor subunit TctC
VKALVAAAKADPGKIVFASPGFAATQHFAGEMFKQTAQVNLLHVPFKTSPEAINATLGKHADVLFDTVSALIGHVQSGQLKALAVTGKDRFPAVPDIPAAAESAQRKSGGPDRARASGYRRCGGQDIDARSLRGFPGQRIQALGCRA